MSGRDVAVPGLAQRLRSALSRARHRRMVWWHEVLIVAAGYLLYTWIRNGVSAREGLAFVRAIDVIRLEQTLHIFHELAFNQLVAAHQHLAELFNYYYALAHFVVTIAVGIWVLARFPQLARSLRSVWYAMNVVALLGYALFPLAPPRLLPGFVDTVVTFHTWGSWGSDSVASTTNQYAAMPSMHVGWSLWCGIVMVRLATRWWVRALGAAYPVVTLTVIVGTGNHYLVDAIGGALALGAGFLIHRLVSGHGAFVPDRNRAAPTAGTRALA